MKARRRIRHRFLPGTASEAARYLTRLGALLAVCDAVGLAIVYFQRPWAWDPPTAIGTTVFVGSLLTCLMLFGEAYGFDATVRRATINTRLLGAVVDAREDEIRGQSADSWWAILALSLFIISSVYVFSSTLGLLLSLVPVPIGAVAWTAERLRRPNPRGQV